MANRTISYWNTLDIGFEGFFMCRLTTDPDPTDEQRGVSGYTLALAVEDDLDNWIQLNPSLPYLQRNLREPLRSRILQPHPHQHPPGMGTPIDAPIDAAAQLQTAGPPTAEPPLGAALFDSDSPLGVKVTSVQIGGQDYAPARQLLGAQVNLLNDPQRPHHKPAFHGRNDIIGSDDNILFPIDPFILEIAHQPNNPSAPLRVCRKDVLPGDQPLWSLPEPTYAYRVGQMADPSDPASMEVMEAIGVYEFYEYFRNRSDYLIQQRGWLQERRAQTHDQEQIERYTTEIEMYNTRLYAIEFFGDRIRSRLGLQRLWSFSIQGSPGIVQGLEGVDVDTDAPWPIDFWFGGFDGDLLIGYMRGTLHLPRRV